MRGEKRMLAKKMAVAMALALCAVAAQAQSTVGELLDKGAKKLGKDDFAAQLPATFFSVWPTKQGEEDVLFKPDGTLSANGRHYQSNTTSPGTGTWTVDESGKWCVSKYWSVWNTSSKACWYAFAVGDEYFFSASDTDRGARVIAAKLKK